MTIQMVTFSKYFFPQETQHRMNYLMNVHIFEPEHLVLNATVVLWPQNIYPIFEQSDEVNNYPGMDLNGYSLYKL